MPYNSSICILFLSCYGFFHKNNWLEISLRYFWDRHWPRFFHTACMVCGICMGSWTKSCQLTEKVFSGANGYQSSLRISSFSIYKKFQNWFFNCLALLWALTDQVKGICLCFCFSIKKLEKKQINKRTGQKKIRFVMHVLKLASKYILSEDFSIFLQSF